MQGQAKDQPIRRTKVLRGVAYDDQPVPPKAVRLSLRPTGESSDHLTARHHNPPERCLRFSVFSDRHQRTFSQERTRYLRVVTFCQYLAQERYRQDSAARYLFDEGLDARPARFQHLA